LIFVVFLRHWRYIVTAIPAHYRSSLDFFSAVWALSFLLLDYAVFPCRHEPSSKQREYAKEKTKHKPSEKTPALACRDDSREHTTRNPSE